MKRGLAAAVFALVVTGIVGFTTIDGAVQLDAKGITGVVPVANGGTGSATQNFVDLTTAQTIAGTKTFTSAVTSSVASGANAFVLNSGAKIATDATGAASIYELNAGDIAIDAALGKRVKIGNAGNLLLQVGQDIGVSTNFGFISTGAIAFTVATAGARIAFGPGANDYFVANSGNMDVAESIRSSTFSSSGGSLIIGAGGASLTTGTALTAKPLNGTMSSAAKIVAFNDGTTEQAYVRADGSIWSSSSAYPVPVATNLAGSSSNPVAIQADSVTLAAGTGTYTFAPAFAADPKCVCTDTTAVAAVKCSHTATTLTVAGTGTDVIDFHCIGRK